MKRLRLALLAVLLVLLPSAVWAQDVVPSARVKRAVVVRSYPDTRSEPVGRLAPGATATLAGETPGWYRVTLADGRTGFVTKSWTVVRTDALRSIAPSAPIIPEVRAHVIDVGTGLAVFIEGPGFTVLYDAGSQDDLGDGPDNRVVAYIRAVRPDVRAIDHLVLSHPHKDHLELMPDVFSAFEVRNVWDSGALNRTIGYCRFLKAVEAETGVRYHDAVATGGFRQVTFTNGGCNGPISIPRAAMMDGAPVPSGRRRR